MILTSAFSHPGSCICALLSNTTNRPSTTCDSLESETDRLGTQLDFLQVAITAKYEEDLSARERYVELLSFKLKEAEKTAERWRREAEKDKLLLAKVQHVLEQECESLEEVLRAERTARSSQMSNTLFRLDAVASIMSESNEKSLKASQRSSASLLDHELFEKRTQELETIARERDQLLSDLEDEKQHSQRLAASLSAADIQYTILASAFATAKDTIMELQAKEGDHLRAREAAEEQVTSVRQDSEVRVTALLEDMAGLRSKHEQEVEVMKRNIETLEYEREQAERRSFDNGATESRVEALEKESERARRRVWELERGSGNRELEIARLKKKLQAIEDDKDGLNIALDLKQQELEMLKRKFDVQGTAGTTPLPTRHGIMPRTLSIPYSAASIASSSITESVNGYPAGLLLDRMNLPSRRSVPSTMRARIVPRPSNPMEAFKHPNSSSNSRLYSTLEDSNVTMDMAATPRAGTRDEENRRALHVPT